MHRNSQKDNFFFGYSKDFLYRESFFIIRELLNGAKHSRIYKKAKAILKFSLFCTVIRFATSATGSAQLLPNSQKDNILFINFKDFLYRESFFIIRELLYGAKHSRIYKKAKAILKFSLFCTVIRFATSATGSAQLLPNSQKDNILFINFKDFLYRESFLCKNRQT